MNYVYLLEHQPSGRVYVGQTGQPRTRWYGHASKLRRGIHENQYLQRSWAKHGEDAFEFMVLGQYDTPAECHEAEMFYIDWFRQQDLSFNATAGGERETGRIISEADRARRRAYRATPETRRRLSEAHRGQVVEHSPERRAQIKAQAQGRRLSPEAVAKARAALTGRVVPQAERDQRSIKMKALHEAGHYAPISDETKAKMSAAKKGKPSHMAGKHHTAEANERNRLAHLGRPPSNKGQPVPEERRQKIAASLRAYQAKRRDAVA